MPKPRSHYRSARPPRPQKKMKHRGGWKKRGPRKEELSTTTPLPKRPNTLKDINFPKCPDIPTPQSCRQRLLRYGGGQIPRIPKPRGGTKTQKRKMMMIPRVFKIIGGNPQPHLSPSPFKSKRKKAIKGDNAFSPNA